jgi:thioredoxin-like negative regulator of GroEL
MILLFTSENCKWCDVLKDMIEEESEETIHETEILEIDVAKYRKIAEAYGVLVVPTLVAHANSLSGLPAADDLRSFLLSAATENVSSDSLDSREVISQAVQLQRSVRVEPTPEHPMTAGKVGSGEGSQKKQRTRAASDIDSEVSIEKYNGS